jgi:uncharacterized membrane protein
MNTTTSVLSVLLVAAAGIQLGTLWIMKLSILPMLNSLRYDGYVEVCQSIDMHMFHPIAVWQGIISAGLGFVAAAMAPAGPESALYVVGSLAMIGVGIASEGFNRPIWRQIEVWSPERPASRWAAKRYTWHIAHQVRTYAAMVAVAAYGVAFLAQVA